MTSRDRRRGRAGEARLLMPPGLAVLVGWALASILAASWPRLADAQAAGSPAPYNAARTADAELDSLVRIAIATGPAVRAAVARAEAARARVGPAGARPDPMLMAGMQNIPITEPGFSDFMTMKMAGVGQTVPYPGKLRLRAQAAEQELAATLATVEEVRRAVAREVRTAYYDMAFAAQALEIVTRTQAVLAGLVPATEAHYAAGTGPQSDVLRARVEATRLAEEAAALAEAGRAALARLNAALDRPSDTPVRSPAIPDRVVRAAVADSAHRISFVSPALGSRVAGSPVPPLDSLQSLAVRQNPALRAHEAMLAAQADRVELARKEHLPDLDVSLQYGQRDGFSDMVTATVSVPLPLQKGRKQDAQVAEARAELAALEAEHGSMANRLRADVAELHAALERGRTQLALYVKAILPQGRAALASAAAAYQVARIDFGELLDVQGALFTYETQYYRALADFAKTLAQLEERVGAEVLR